MLQSDIFSLELLIVDLIGREVQNPMTDSTANEFEKEDEHYRKCLDLVV